MAKVSGQRKIYQMINKRIIDLLDKGDIPWRKPWISGEPVNFISRKLYRGINPFILIQRNKPLACQWYEQWLCQ